MQLQSYRRLYHECRMTSHTMRYVGFTHFRSPKAIALRQFYISYPIKIPTAGNETSFIRIALITHCQFAPNIQFQACLGFAVKADFEPNVPHEGCFAQVCPVHYAPSCNGFLERTPLWDSSLCAGCEAQRGWLGNLEWARKETCTSAIQIRQRGCDCTYLSDASTELRCYNLFLESRLGKDMVVRPRWLFSKEGIVPHRFAGSQCKAV